MEVATNGDHAQHHLGMPHGARSDYSSGSDMSRGGGHAGSSGGQAQQAAAAGEAGPPRKLVILGLPYFTSDDTLHGYFSQLGQVEEALVMRDHASGRSRGFGFVTFITADDAARVAGREYSVDGRRCEAKFALPRGESASQRVTRIFVAKLPPHVAEDELRTYFEQYGAIQDVYMPKDASKQARRGIGFVTFASPEAVDAVIRTTHVLHGQELVVDKAAPKQKEPFPLGAGLPGATSSGVPYRSAQPSLSAERLASLSNGAFAGLIPGGYGFGGHGLQQQQHVLPGSMAGGALSGSAGSLYDAFGGAINGTQEDGNGDMGLSGLGFVDHNANGGLHGLHGLQGSNPGMQYAIAQLARAQQAAQLGLSLTFDGRPSSSLNLGAAAAAAAAQNGSRPTGAPGSANSLTDLDRMYGAQQQQQAGLSNGLPNGLVSLRGTGGGGQTSPGGVRGGGGGTLGADPGAAGGASAGGGGALCTNRVFIGKLGKDVMEADIKEYCSRFGYVLDVYIPRDKNNKREHRGFGFVTFETEAAVDRILAFDDHQIHGSVIAVDRALPRQEDTSQSSVALSGDQQYGADVSSDAVSAALGMAALGLGANGQVLPGPARHNNDRNRYLYQPY